MKILVVGLGLIGGSFCKALTECKGHEIYGLDNNKEVIQSAMREGCIKSGKDETEINSFDMVIVCLHPEAAHSFMLKNIPCMKKNSIIFDVCGIKGRMVHEMTSLAKENGCFYVGTHPMAGKECFGFENSDGAIFNGANFIVTPIDGTEKNALEIIKNIVKSIGFGRIITTTPEEHDRIISYTSQLAHVVSNAYVKSPTMQKENGFSGGSFQDMTRVATVNESMWTSLFMLNRECLLDEIDTLTGHLKEYRDALEDCDNEKLSSLLRDGRLLKENNIKSHKNGED